MYIFQRISRGIIQVSTKVRCYPNSIPHFHLTEFLGTDCTFECISSSHFKRKMITIKNESTIFGRISNSHLRFCALSHTKEAIVPGTHHFRKPVNSTSKILVIRLFHHLPSICLQQISVSLNEVSQAEKPLNL